jgi:mannose-6-phosphate isomerase-like protein (cupin superfamily)
MKRVEKPWGWEIWWSITDHYAAKILHIHANHKLSRQYHNLKEETFMVKSGEMELEIGNPPNIILTMKDGDVFHCPPKTVHRMVAKTDVEVIEVSTPELSDVVRISDDYGR